MAKLSVKKLQEMLAAAKIEEKQEKIRESQAKRVAYSNRLFIDLQSMYTADNGSSCGVNFRTPIHFEQTFQTAICEPQTECPFRTECLEYAASLTHKSAKRSSSGTRRVSSNNIPIDKDFSVNGQFTFSFIPGGAVEKTVITIGGYADFQEFKNELKRLIPMKRAVELGLTAGQWQGLTHYNSMRKLGVPKN